MVTSSPGGFILSPLLTHGALVNLFSYFFCFPRLPWIFRNSSAMTTEEATTSKITHELEKVKMEEKSTASLPDPAQSKDAAQDINPWSVSGAIVDGKLKEIDYNRLVETFGTQLITTELLERFERVTGHKPHPFLRRGLVFSHRDLDWILSRHEKGEPFFLYTGRGPSSDSMHLGHMIPFTFTKLVGLSISRRVYSEEMLTIFPLRWLQDVFDVPLVIMMTDDEKIIFGKKAHTLDEMQVFMRNNAKDILAVGFDMKKTFLFSDFDFMGKAFYQNVVQISRLITYNTSKAVFGFNDRYRTILHPLDLWGVRKETLTNSLFLRLYSDNIGKSHYVAVQSATAFATTFPHIFGPNQKKNAKIPSLIPCAIDQDPYFRVCRDVAPRLNYCKPA
jgi:tryptophanyl-tRNA synthetase